MLRRSLAWSGALTVMVITAALVVLDVADASVHRYWSRHGFTSSVLSGVLVLLLTLLIVDRVAQSRQVKSRSRAIAAQTAIILAQAVSTADAVGTMQSAEDHDEASGQLRTYTQMLLTSAPVLIDAPAPRAFLEASQRLAGQMFRVLHDSPNKAEEQSKAKLDHAIKRLRADAAPLLSVLSPQERRAVSAEYADDSG